MNQRISANQVQRIAEHKGFEVIDTLRFNEFMDGTG